MGEKRTKEVNLKELNLLQKEAVKRINNQIIEYQHMFSLQPEELLISKTDFDNLSNKEELDFITLSNIKIYRV
jgi:hypothetical protein